MEKIDIKKTIEENIEKKFNDILDKIPITDLSVKKDNDYINYSIKDLYINTLNTIINIINDIINLINESYYISDKMFIYVKLYDIFFMKDRLLYVGILFVILSFIIYFIDNSK